MSRKRRWHQRQEDFPKLNAKRSPREVADTEKEEAWEFEQQLSAELLSVLSSPAEAWRYESACRDVRSALLRFLRVPFHLHQFGSSATGLAFNGSDIDLCLELLRPSARPLINLVPSALRSQRGVFTHVMPVKGARVPIVKFRHAPSGISGDVSFSGTLAVRNTALIRALCAMDARVHPLLALTKRWAQTQGVANSEGEAHRLSSYALALMAVFYLQQRGILPPIAALTARCHPQQSELGWQCGIAPIAWQPRDPSVGLRDLATGLFAFYAAFAFDADVVCPLLGRAVSREAFANAATLPPEMSAYADRIIQPPAPNRQTTSAQSAGQTNGQPSEEQTIVETSASEPNADPPNAVQPLDAPTAPNAPNVPTAPNAPTAPTAPNAPGTGKRKTPRAARPIPVGLALRNNAMCVQDPFALDHNVARGQTDKEFARLAKVLAHAALVCRTTPGRALLPTLLTRTPATAVLSRRTIRREAGEPSTERWAAEAVDVARNVMESVLLARVTPLADPIDGWTSFACAVPRDVTQGRTAAVALCKAETPLCANLSPVQLQAAASARIVRNRGAKAAFKDRSAPLARLVVRVRAAPGLVVEVHAEEPDVKAATHWANFYLNGLQRWLPAELKFRAAAASKTASAGSRDTIEGPSTAAQDPIAAQEPSTAAQDPIAAQEPSTAAQDPIAAQEPSTAAQDPIAAQEPSTAAQDPIAAQEPSTAAQDPIAAQEPSTAAQDPIAAQEPSTAAQDPIAAQEPSTAILESQTETEESAWSMPEAGVCARDAQSALMAALLRD